MVPIEYVNCNAAPAVTTAVPTTVSTAAKPINKLALCCIVGIWIAWFALPFLSIAIGPFPLAEPTLWDCLDFASSSVFKFLGLCAIAAPLLAVFAKKGIARVFYLAPITYLICGSVYALAQIGQLARYAQTALANHPYLSLFAKDGADALIQSSSLGLGAYCLGFASVVLSFQIFARR
jgi:hypothetical protein